MTDEQPAKEENPDAVGNLTQAPAGVEASEPTNPANFDSRLLKSPLKISA
jgi:hypothetical protein